LLENAGLENVGQKKSRGGGKCKTAKCRTKVQGLKMQDWKMSDKSARLEFDGLAMRVRL